jgi:hypothetical protein
MKTNHVKVFFRLEPDEDDWPPVAAESVWAEPDTLQDTYIIANVPFFTRDATVGDKVQVRSADGVLWFAKLLMPSANSLIRIIVPKDEMLDGVNSHLLELGCDTEICSQFNLIAANIPPQASLLKVQDYLQMQCAANILDFEESILRHRY